MKAPRKKIYHRAMFIDPDGNVSALCFRTPHAIDLKKALWTNRDEAVTCPRCKVAIGDGKEADAIAPREAAALDALEKGTK